jgi:hypothetical protein
LNLAVSFPAEPIVIQTREGWYDRYVVTGVEHLSRIFSAKRADRVSLVSWDLPSTFSVTAEHCRCNLHVQSNEAISNEIATTQGEDLYNNDDDHRVRVATADNEPDKLKR